MMRLLQPDTGKNAWELQERHCSESFFVVAAPDGRLLATGYLDLSTGSIEAVFTLPQYTGKGLGSQIIEAIKSEARGRGFEQLTLSSTPNAQTFYEKHGFKLMQESMYPSALAQAELRCMEMSINLTG